MKKMMTGRSMILVVFFYGFGDVGGSLEPPDHSVTLEMQNYIMGTTVTLSTVRDTVGLVATDDHHTKWIVEFLLRFKNKTPVLISLRGGEYIRHVNDEKTINLFCFVSSVEDFGTVFADIRSSPFFLKRGFIQFIVGKSVTDKNWLMKLIWNNDILNYVIVYQIGKTVEVIGYNPFNNTLYNFTNHPIGHSIYPEKLNDVYGLALNVGMITDIPRHRFVDDQIVGPDAILIREVAKKINATLNLIIYSSGKQMTEDIASKKIHVSFIKHFSHTNSHYIVQPSYPTQLDYVVIAVPTPEAMPHYKYLFLTFNYKVWIAIALAIVVMVFINAFFARVTNFKHKSMMDSFLCVFRVFLNTVYIDINIGKPSKKVLLISWAFYSLLMSTAFSTTLRDSLINTKYNTEIRTLQELRTSGLKIAVNYVALQEVMGEFRSLKKQLLYVNDTFAIVNLMLNQDKSMAYALYLTYMEKLVLQRDSYNRFVYSILGQNMIGGHSVYNFAKNSPYMEHIDRLLLLFKQFGLSKFGTGETATLVLGGNDNVALSMDHMQAAFIVLISGYILGTLAFVEEQVAYLRSGRRLAMH